MKTSEKRGAQRVPYVTEVVCEGDGVRCIGRSSDLSSSGVFIHSKEWLDAGSILTLKFSVNSTPVEISGEVCYTIPHVGMGVRFLDINHELHAAVERLFESQRAHAESESLKRRDVAPSGVEPVDKLLGGLQRGHLYLAHGEASGKSLFGAEFLIEGLKHGHPGAIITSHFKEDTVRRFARLGHDCSEDIRRGSLVLFQYSHETVEQLRKVPHLEPLLRELGPILDESSPERIVFDPVNTLLTGANKDDVTARARELAAWVRSFGATVVLVASEEDFEIIESLTPAVTESFRFGVKESSDRFVRFIAFEKSSLIRDHAIRVDPSRGISLLEPLIDENVVTPEITAGGEAGEIIDNGNEGRSPREQHQSSYPDQPSSARRTEQDPSASAGDSSAGDGPVAQQAERLSGDARTTTPLGGPASGSDSEESHDAFFAMLDELQTFASSLDRDAAEPENAALSQ